ncbi:hypothetical protein AAG906_034884 [Vitis piasezkii]
MVSLRFPFSFSQPPNPPAASGAAVAAAVAVSQNPINPFLQNAFNFFSNHSSPFWASLSIADNPSSVSESKTGVLFPSILNDSRQLLGTGLRKKSVLGLKNIDVYAFGTAFLYYHLKSIQCFSSILLLSEKYGKLSFSEKKDLSKDLMEADICMTVRLQIVYSRLSIRSVRSAFEESVGSRLQKLGGSDNKELLHRFTSQFKDEYKIPKGSVIDLSRNGTFDGKEVGNIQSQLLCRSILDLYIGEDPFDRRAKEEVELKLVSLLQK